MFESENLYNVIMKFKLINFFINVHREDAYKVYVCKCYLDMKTQDNQLKRLS